MLKVPPLTAYRLVDPSSNDFTAFVPPLCKMVPPMARFVTDACPPVRMIVPAPERTPTFNGASHVNVPPFCTSVPWPLLPIVMPKKPGATRVPPFRTYVPLAPELYPRKNPRPDAEGMKVPSDCSIRPLPEFPTQTVALAIASSNRIATSFIRHRASGFSWDITPAQVEHTS